MRTAVFNLFARAGLESKIQPSGQLADIGCNSTLKPISASGANGYVLVLISPAEDQLAIFNALKAEMDASLFTFANQGKIPNTSLFDLSAAEPTSTNKVYPDYRYWYCPEAWDPSNDATKESPRPDLCAPPGAV
jgi:hypothetical protein